MSRDRLVVRSIVSSAILASISLVSSERVRAMPSALDRSLDTSASIPWREVSADCASKGALASGMGVGAGVGFAGEPDACWPGAVPPLKNKARIIKRIRITGCVTGLSIVIWQLNLFGQWPLYFRGVGSTAPSEPVAPPAIWGRTNILTEIARFRPARKEADAYRLYRPKVPYRWSTVQKALIEVGQP